MTTRTPDRFDDVDALEARLASILAGPASWQVEGKDVALCGRLGPDLRLEVVPLTRDRARVRVEGVLDRESLLWWVDRARRDADSAPAALPLATGC